MIDKIKLYIREILTDEVCRNLKYHNLSHTEGVVEKVKIISEGENVSTEDKEALQIAAWFHDVGYVKDPKNHESISYEIAAEFLDKNDYKPELKKVIKPLIMVTKMGATPTNLLEEIMKDADTAHIGSQNYSSIANELRKEWKICNGTEMSDHEWLLMNEEFLSKHHFNTPTAEKTYGPQKMRNLEEIRSLIDGYKNPKEKKKKKKKKNQKNKARKSNLENTEKGRETAYRVALRNHIQLSKIADNKANIMLSVNALILSFLLGTGIPQAEGEPELIFPTLILILTSILSVIFATLSTRPKVTHGNLSKQEILDKKGNLLFFGNFHSMDIETYEWGMTELMKDSDYLYNSMNRDLFYLGKVMHRKYKWLSLTYTTFASGMILSTLAFLFLTYHHM